MRIFVLILTCWALCLSARAAGPVVETPAERGLRLLLDKPYLPADFDQHVFDELWQSWEEPARSLAEKATIVQRRKMAFARYGLIERPGDPRNRPMQYVVSADGSWTMNCLACHQGSVAGRMIPGAPNTRYALETLTEDVRNTKLRLGIALGRMEVGSLFLPLGTTVGTTNAVMFGVSLMAHRDAELNVQVGLPRIRLVNHDHDAPAWWNYSARKTLYCDGFAPKGHRGLMQFILVKENGPEKFREWEADFRDIEAYIQSLKPPRFPWPIDEPLSRVGRKVFEQNCARCHGSYEIDSVGQTKILQYPDKIVPIQEVGTDRVRLDALSIEHRRDWGQSWFAEKGKLPVTANPGGYVAPPLHGIWASAPYFHNGSVPTLWHVLHPDERPAVWRHHEDAAGYDRNRVGLTVKTFSEMQMDRKLPSHERRMFFDTRVFGKNAAGHEFPAALTEQERTALLEYLKTL